MAEVPEDPNISVRSRKVLIAHVQRVAYAYEPLYIKIVGTISC
jgi:hypothetical protein